MTPTTCTGIETKTPRRWQVGPIASALPYTNSPPMREEGGQNHSTDLDLLIAAIMPSIAEIESLGDEHFKEWQDDRSWADYKDE